MVDLRIKQKLLFSLLGYGLPLLVAVVTIPWLIHQMGVEWFGLLTLAWVLVGFASIFDFGLGRVLTRETAWHVKQQTEQQLWVIVRFVLSVMVAISLFISALLYFLLPWLLGDVLVWSSNADIEQAITAVRWLLLAVPLTVFNVALVAMLEGSGLNKRVNLVRALSGALLFVLPALAWFLYANMVAVMLSLILVRFLATMANGVALKSVLVKWFRVKDDHIKPNFMALLKMGGWVSVSALLAPMLTTFDRFVIGALVSVEMVAYYATPVDMIMKLQAFSSAVMAVVFPAFSASYVNHSDRTQRLFFLSSALLFAVMFLAALVSVLFARPLLSWWLDDNFAAQSSQILQWAAIGLFVNAISFVPFGLLQAIGRADLTAKVNLIELPFYAGLLYWGLTEYGIVGAAIAFSIRLAVNTTVLLCLAGYHAPCVRNHSVLVAGGMWLAVALLCGVSECLP